jgi:hypothetical protein
MFTVLGVASRATGFLRRHEDRFFPFVDTGLDVDMAGYCRREVEPMGRECEQLHIIALTEYLGLRVAIEYLDGRWVFNCFYLLAFVFCCCRS